MSKHQQTREADQTDDKATGEAPASHSLPATAIVRQMLAGGRADPKAIADVMVAHPGARMEIFMLLHKTMGNAFASEVSRQAIAAGGLGEPRDVATFDASSEYREARATIDQPRGEVVEQVDDGGYREARATIDHPHLTEGKKEAPWMKRARSFNLAHADNVRAFLDSTGTSCIDEETGELDPNKVARWQKEHGLPPDGRVGDQTVAAAVSDPSLAL